MIFLNPDNYVVISYLKKNIVQNMALKKFDPHLLLGNV